MIQVVPQYTNHSVFCILSCSQIVTHEYEIDECCSLSKNREKSRKIAKGDFPDESSTRFWGRFSLPETSQKRLQKRLRIDIFDLP